MRLKIGGRRGSKRTNEKKKQPDPATLRRENAGDAVMTIGTHQATMVDPPEMPTKYGLTRGDPECLKNLLMEADG